MHKEHVSRPVRFGLEWIAALFICGCQATSTNGRLMSPEDIVQVREALGARIAGDPALVDIIRPAIGFENAAPLVPILVELLERDQADPSNRVNWWRVARVLSGIGQPAKESLAALLKCRDYRLRHFPDSDDAMGNAEQEIAFLEIAIHSIEQGKLDPPYGERKLHEANVAFAVRSIGVDGKGDKEFRNAGIFHLRAIISRTDYSAIINDRSDDLVSALVLALDDGEEFNVERSVELLGVLGPRARKALPALTKLSQTAWPSWQGTLIPKIEESIRRIGD